MQSLPMVREFIFSLKILILQGLGSNFKNKPLTRIIIYHRPLVDTPQGGDM